MRWLEVLRELTRKEVVTLLRNKRILISMIVMPVVMFTVLGLVYSVAFSGLAKQVASEVRNMNVLVCDLDHSNFSKEVIDLVKSKALSTSVVNECRGEVIAKALSSSKYSVALVIPKGAGSNFSNGLPVRVKVFTEVSGASVASTTPLMIAGSLINWLNTYIRATIAGRLGINPEFILNPIMPKEYVVFRGKVTSPEVVEELSMAMSFFIMAPIVVMMAALNFAATSMASENEEKTLEVLLSLPIPRTKLVISKLGGTLAVVLISTISFGAGLVIYAHLLTTGLSSMTHQAGGHGVSGLSLLSQMGVGVVGLTVLSMFTSLTAIASLGLLIGSLTPNLRSSSMIIGQLSMIIIIPNILMMFLPLNYLGSGGIAAVVALSPFIGPVLTLKSLLSGHYWIVPASISWSLCFSALIMYVTSRLLNSERLLMIQHSLLRRGMRRWRIRRRSVISR